jgi:hypothetical protein
VVQVDEVMSEVRAPSADDDVPAFWRALGLPGLAGAEELPLAGTRPLGAS